jgi:hypothetical protein
MPASAIAGGAAGIAAWWNSQAPALLGGASPATLYGTVSRDAGPTASLSGPEYALTEVPGLTPAQIAQANKSIAAGASTGPGAATPGETPGQAAQNVDTLYSRAGNLLNQVAAAGSNATIASSQGIPISEVAGISSAEVPAVMADVKSVQDSIIAQTEAAYGPGATPVPVSAIVKTWSQQDRAAYNQLHGTSY